MSSGAAAERGACEAVFVFRCCLLAAAELQGLAGPAPLDIPVIACVNSLPWNSFSKDGPPWGAVQSCCCSLSFVWFFFLPARHHLSKVRLRQERFICVTL